MAFLYALDPTTPLGTESAKQGDDRIREAKAALKELLASFFADVDVDPMVPRSESVPWACLFGIPAYATRWPTWDEVTGKPATFIPAAHTHDWTAITSGVPETATRWPSWGEVTDKPVTFDPSAHTHTFASLDAKPTTLAGFGITDALSAATAATTYLALTGGTMSGTLGSTATEAVWLANAATTDRRYAMLANSSGHILFAVEGAVGGNTLGTSLPYEGILRAGAELVFSAAGSVAHWRINSSGHWIAGADGTYDFGQSGVTRARHGYFAGTVHAATGFNFSATQSFAANSGGVNLYTVLHDGSNALALHLGGTGDAANYYSNDAHTFRSRGGVSVYAAITNSGLSINGTRTLTFVGARTMGLGLGAGGELLVSDVTAGVTRWSYSATGHYLPGADASYDLGSATFRVRDIFMSGVMKASKVSTQDGTTSVASGGTLASGIADGTYLVTIWNSTTYNGMQVTRVSGGNGNPMFEDLTAGVTAINITGGNLTVAHSAGVSTSFDWSVLRLS